jgi:hypothetical protein
LVLTFGGSNPPAPDSSAGISVGEKAARRRTPKVYRILIDAFIGRLKRISVGETGVPYISLRGAVSIHRYDEYRYITLEQENSLD